MTVWKIDPKFEHWVQIQIEIISDLVNNAVMCTLDLNNVFRITRHLDIKLKSFSNLVELLHEQIVYVADQSFIPMLKNSDYGWGNFFVDVIILHVFLLSRTILHNLDIFHQENELLFAIFFFFFFFFFDFNSFHFKTDCVNHATWEKHVFLPQCDKW